MDNMIPKRQLRRKIAREARALAARIAPSMNMDAACLVQATAFVEIAKRHDLPAAKLYAGTAYWPTEGGRPDPLRFGYEWEPNTLVHLDRVANRRMPEMHVWAGFGQSPVVTDRAGRYIGPEVIVDLTARSWPAQQRVLAPWMSWDGPVPPDVFWGRPEDLPVGAKYRPYREAGELVIEMLTEWWGR